MLLTLPLMIVGAWLANRHGRRSGLRAHDLTRFWLRTAGPFTATRFIPLF